MMEVFYLTISCLLTLESVVNSSKPNLTVVKNIYALCINKEDHDCLSSNTNCGLEREDCQM